MTKPSQGSIDSMPNPKKDKLFSDNPAGKNSVSGSAKLKDSNKDTTPVKATDRVSSQRPGSSQGNIPNAGGK